VEDKPGVIKELERLEGIVFDWQIRVQQQQMAILDEEEKLIRTQMEAITNQIKGIIDSKLKTKVHNNIHVFPISFIFFISYCIIDTSKTPYPYIYVLHLYCIKLINLKLQGQVIMFTAIDLLF
jgi:hypothetical protein